MNPELALFRENVRRFVAEEVAPNYARWEKEGIFPRQLWKDLGEQGLLAADIPEEYGGFGTDFLFSMAIQEELSSAILGQLDRGFSVVHAWGSRRGNREHGKDVLHGNAGTCC